MIGWEVTSELEGKWDDAIEKLLRNFTGQTEEYHDKLLAG